MRKRRKLTKVESVALPGPPLSPEELLAIVKEAEKGPFITIEEFVRKFQAWKNEHYKK